MSDLVEPNALLREEKKSSLKFDIPKISANYQQNYFDQILRHILDDDFCNPGVDPCFDMNPVIENSNPEYSNVDVPPASWYMPGRSTSCFDSTRLSIPFHYSQPENVNEFFTADFADSHKWCEEYQRNNRNGGMKNIRCFPYCGPKHYPTGFCGESLLVMVKTNSSARRVYAYCEIGLSQIADDKIIKVGDVVSSGSIMDKVRTRDRPFKSWWDGDLRESKETVGRDSLSTQREFAFEFNRSKRGWHYGWVANKYISNMKHKVRAYIFVPSATESNVMRCVSVASSPEFTLYSRKPKREAVPVPVRIPTPTEHIMGLKSEERTRNKNTRKRTNPGKSRKETSVKKLSSRYLTSDEWNILKRAKVDLQKNRNQKAVDDINLARFCESLNYSNMKGKDVFKVLQRILELPSNAYSQSLSSVISVIKKKEKNPDHSKENKALTAFAKFLISDEEELTEIIQSKMETLNPFESKNNAPYSIQEKTEDVMTTAKNSFNEFLAPFEVDIDTCAKEYEDCNSNQGCKNNYTSTENAGSSFEEARKSIVQNQLNFAMKNESIPMNRRKNGPENKFLTAFEGTWIRSEETLTAYDRVYTRMCLPYALKKCYLHMVKKTTMSPCGDPDSMITQYNRKLFSNGVIRYIFDGKLRPWSLTPPLMSTPYDAVAYRSWINEDQQQMNIEHHFKTYKLLRSYRVNGNRLEGHAILFNKTEGVGDCVEWTQMDKLPISAIKSN